jgi:hypothetical protein
VTRMSFAVFYPALKDRATFIAAATRRRKTAKIQGRAEGATDVLLRFWRIACLLPRATRDDAASASHRLLYSAHIQCAY